MLNKMLFLFNNINNLSYIREERKEHSSKNNNNNNNTRNKKINLIIFFFQVRNSKKIKFFYVIFVYLNADMTFLKC